MSKNSVVSKDITQVQTIQEQLATAIRLPLDTGEFETDRLKIYQDLFFTNINTLLSGMFPVAQDILGESAWSKLIRAFMVHHKAKTPLFLELGEEFLAFIQHSIELGADWVQNVPAYFLSLCHYEWVEIAVDISEGEAPDPSAAEGDSVLLGTPRLSPTAVVLHYTYPVHQVSKTNASPEPVDTFLVVYRNRALEVCFIELKRLAFQLLSSLQQGIGLSGRDLVAYWLKEDHLDEKLQSAGEQELLKWQEIGLIY